MKITTWNVNGLRANINKGFFETLEQLGSDVVCLQEVKSRPEQLQAEHQALLGSRFTHITWNPAQRPGYSGTLTLARTPPSETLTGMGFEEYDGEGRLIAHRYTDFWLFNIYFPNGGRDLSRVPYKLDFYARLLDWCDRMHSQGENIILCGDFNTAHNEIDIKHAKANSKNTGFLPEERAWIDTYLAHGFIDPYRCLYPTRVQYTWWSYMGQARTKDVGWRLDYFLVSAGFFSRVEDVFIHTDMLGSDHCPVTLVLKPGEDSLKP
jgi:exodeoxyribonuclease-3